VAPPAPAPTSALKTVVLPTFGSPIMPQHSPTTFYLSRLLRSTIRSRSEWLAFTAGTLIVHPASKQSARFFLCFIRLFPNIELIHGDFGPAMNQTFHRVDRPLETRLEDLHFVLADRFQHIIRRVLPRRRTPDADFQSHKLGGP